NYTVLPPGKWRGVLKLAEPGLIESQTITGETTKLKDYFELPFNMNVEYINDSMHVYLLNGEESIEIENVNFGRDPKTAKDSIRFEFVAFDSYMEGYHEENFIEG
ncbi:MAG: TlpA family protein disulfide reductase, partial [Bacteroidia bacterium]|nr:TlpA family protein disulfide reductase [Bacteroidia bacterium]